MVYSFLALVLIISNLVANPSIASIQQAVSQNPSLLETPQAKAMMQEKGVSSQEVKEKISSDHSSVESETSLLEAENDLDMIEDDKKKTANAVSSRLIKKVKPFRFKTNARLRAEMSRKQQGIVTSKLKRYSSSFYANKNKLDSSSLPTPDDYIISAGDKIGIHLYGDRDRNYKLTVKNDGRVELAFIGPIKIAGMKFIDAKKHLKRQLKSHFKNSEINININSYSTIQVTLLGEVKYPGMYNLSSFSGVKDLLIVSKGTKDTASVRNIIIKRDSEVIAKLDFYDLLFEGNDINTLLLKQGDTVIIEKAKKLVSIDGYVNNTSIFELKRNENLHKLIEYAGGMKPSASKTQIKIDRYSDNSKFETFKVSYKNSKQFKMKNGDKVYIYPLDFTAKNTINIYGNIIRPGSYKLNNKKTLNEFFKNSVKEGMKKFFLPNTNFEYAVIKRYNKDLKYTSESFNLLKVINGKEKIKITPNDEVYIFSTHDIYSNSYITTGGSVLSKPGKLQYINGITIKDAINASGIKGILDDKIRVTSYATNDYMPKTTFYSLEKEGDVRLNPYDQVEVYDYYATHILEPVSIKGEVVKPATVHYEEGMTVQDLLNIAGGFNKKAYTKSVSLIRYYVDETQTRQKKVLSYKLDEITLGDIKLEPYDEVKISKIFGWEAQHTLEPISIKGQVLEPMTRYYEKGMTAADLISRAGGFNKKAYTKSISLIRYYVDETQTRQQKLMSFRLDEVSLDEIKLEPYDELEVSKILGWEAQDYEVVSISGEVKKPRSVKYGSGMKLSDLILLAEGLNKRAYKKKVEIVRYHVDENETRQRNIIEIDLANKEFSEIALNPYDEVKIFKIPNWSDARSITLSGEVKFPGTYSIEKGERLSDVLKRAGGFTDEAFLDGAVFTRESIKKKQIRHYNETLANVKRELALYNAMPANAKLAQGQQSVNKLDEVIKEAEKYQPIGRVSLSMDVDLDNFEKNDFNLVLENGDALSVPGRIDTVTVFGEVFNPTSFVYNSNKDGDAYIKMASGVSRSSDQDNAYVIHPDGTSEPMYQGFFGSSIEISKGDTIVVPLYIKENNQLDVWDSIAKILSSFALTAAATKTLGVF